MENFRHRIMMDEWIFRSVLSFVFVSASLLPSQTFGIGDAHLCAAPLGMESGDIPNSALSASSYYVKNVGPDTARLNRDTQGGAWCPREPISIGVHEWLQISLNSTHLLSGVQMQGRYSNGLGQEYSEEFQLEYFRDGFSSWRKYYNFNGKSVFPGNTDTSSVITTKLRPPLFADKIRFVPYSAHRRVVCLRVELLGCQWYQGVSEYSAPQGDTFSEGLSLKDETYDGIGTKWDRSVGTSQPGNPSNIEEIERESSESFDEIFTSSSTLPPEELSREVLHSGMGQLTDSIYGANSFTMDVGYGLGNGWVGWRRRPQEKDWIEITFTFDTVRIFSHLTIFTNNYPSKGVQLFGRCLVHFSNGGVYWTSSSPINFVPSTIGVDLSQEQTRNITIPLEDRIGRYIKLQLYYRSSWILLGEVTFSSEVFSGNWTLEDNLVDFPMDTQAPLEIGDLDGSMVETVVGIITGLIFLAGFVAGLVICLRKNGRSLSTAFFHARDRSSSGTFHFPWRHSWNSVPTHIVAQTNPQTDGVKDLLLTLAPAAGNGEINGNPPIYSEAPGRNLLNGLEISPPPYSANVKNGKQGLKFQTYKTPDTASSTSGCYSNNASSASSNPDGNHVTMTLRNNQMCEEDWADDPPSENLPNSTLRSSTNQRRKHKIAMATWNICFSGQGRPRGPRGHAVPDISLRQLRLIENLGSCCFGQVHLYDFEGEVESSSGQLYQNCRLIAKTVKSLSEVRLLGVLDHENLLEMVCLCTELKKPIVCLYPAPECGDLCSFLSRLTNTPSLHWLLSVASQIASGMNYLESLNLIHKDLAARNCLVEREGSIRISDLAMSCEQYRDDYCHTPEGLRPLRWWSWESILSGEFSIHSSVWSFGVTMWEILTLCRQKPLTHIADHQLSTLAEKYAEGGQTWAAKPVLSPPEIFDLMKECWKIEATERPTFQNIHLFLEQKCNSSSGANNGPIYHSIT